MTRTVLDRVGTLELVDTGRRCTVRNVRILAVHCPNCIGPDELIHDAILTPYWEMVKHVNGYHQGCDPDSPWRKDPPGTKLRHDTMRSLLDRVDACPACNSTTCSGVPN